MRGIDEVGRVKRMEELRLRNAGVGLIKRSLRFRHRSYALDTAPSNAHCYFVLRTFYGYYYPVYTASSILPNTFCGSLDLICYVPSSSFLLLSLPVTVVVLPGT